VAEAERAIERRIRRLLQGRSTRFSIVGGVTEAIDNNGELRRDGIIDRFGEEIIDYVYHVAADVDPSLNLIYEDTGFNSRRSQETSVGARARLRLLERLKSRGVPVSGFGDTAQIIIDQWNSGRWFYNEIQDLGMDLHLTEFQTRFLYDNERSLDIGPTEWREKSSRTYAGYIDFFKSFRRAKTITFWTPFDTWNSLRAGGGTFSHASQPNARVGLFDANYLPNQNYDSVMLALSR
jgi:GH35 family endo-1,4-beta-xylanase